MAQYFYDRWFMRSTVSHRHLDIGAIAHPDDIPDFKDPRLTYQVDMNKYQAVHMSNEQEIYRELMEGCGYVVIPQCFSPEDVHHARDLVMYFIRKEGKKATHFHGADDSRADLQARVWNLLNKAEIFQKIVQHPKVTRILDNILGDDFQLGSVATNTLFPGATGQEPHTDYPYWDYYERKHWPVTPKVKEVHFHMNMQATLLLDDFTTENGATAVVPGTQVYPEYPNKGEFFKKCVQVTGRAGDMMLFPGIMQHAAMLNKSSAPRTGVIIQYLPKFVKPMEDIRRVLAPEVIASASPRLRKLLCLDYPYPEVLDEAEPVNSEGSQSNFKWK